MTRFENEHLSFSRLSRYEGCPLSYRLHHIEKRQPEPGVALRFRGGYFYVVGGNAVGVGLTNDVQRAVVQADGSLTAWQTCTPTAPFPGRSGHAALVEGGRPYVLGGLTTGGVVADVWSAPIGGDGCPGTWTSTLSCPSARQGNGAVADNGYVYVLGGNVTWSTGYRSDVQVAPLNGDGAVGACRRPRRSPTAARS